MTSSNCPVIQDKMENFVNDLTNQKKNRWLQIRKETINSRNQSQEETTSAEQRDLIDNVHRCLDFYDEESLEKLIVDAWAEKHIFLLPHEVLCEVLEFAVSVGNRKLFEKLLVQLKSQYSEFYNKNLIYFNGFELIIESKSNMTNIDEILEKFEAFYKKSIADDNNTKQIMRFCSVIIEDCVEKRGESAMIKLKERIEAMCEDSKDYWLLWELWRRLFER